MDWRLKVGVQFVLARTPGGRQMNYALQVLHGSHAPEVVRRRLLGLAANVAWLRAAGLELEGACVVEIGTGWDAINPLLLHALGAGTIHSFDRLPHLRTRPLRRVLVELQNAAQAVAGHAGVRPQGVAERLRRLDPRSTRDEILAAADIRYHAPADAARTGLATGTVDLVYSHDVLEHVAPDALPLLNRESRRLLRPGGLVYHNIGLHDHYAGFDSRLTPLNFLRYSERCWDFWVQNDLSYHNRLRERDFLEIFRRDGLEPLHCQHEIDGVTAESLPGQRVAARFRGYTPEELVVTRTRLALRPVPAGARSR